MPDTEDSATTAGATAYLPLDWLSRQPLRIGQLLLLHGTPPRIDYHGKLEGVTLAVDLYTAHDVDDAPADRPPPGHVALVTGDIGPSERSWLRSRQLSFITSDGVAEIWWPQLRVSAAPAVDSHAPTSRWQTTVPLKGSHARVAQRLLARLADGEPPYPSLSQLAADASVSPPTVSHVMDKLERYGLVSIDRSGRTATPHVADPLALAQALRAASALSTVDTYGAYMYGRDLDERLGRLAASLADAASHEVAVTGLVGAAAYGAVRTNIARADLWLRVPAGHEPTAWMMSLGLEPTDENGAPLRVAIDRTGAAVLDVHRRPVGDIQLPVAHRVRVWVDVHDATRGPDIAQELIDWSHLHDPERDTWTP